MKIFKQEIVDRDEKLNFVNERGEEGRTIEDLMRDYPNEIKRLEEALISYMNEKKQTLKNIIS